MCLMFDSTAKRQSQRGRVVAKVFTMIDKVQRTDRRTDKPVLHTCP